MKKLILSTIALAASLSLSAQTIEVYKYNADGTLCSTPAFTTTDKVKVVFKETIPDYKSQNLKAGDKVEGKVKVEGVTYVKAVGGTVADYVDLGIKDSNGKALLWATHNLGATSSEEYGAYIAWGENGTEEEGYSAGVKATGYDWTTLKYCEGTTYDDVTFTKYVTTSAYGTVDGKLTLDSEDDAATVNWGDEWRTPTRDEWEAITNTDNFTWTYDTTTKGYTVTSKISGFEGKSIFLPAANTMPATSSTGGRYWSSSVYYLASFNTNSTNAHHCSFDRNSIGYINGNLRDYGLSIRPVRTAE